jgi:hypothetical protein
MTIRRLAASSSTLDQIGEGQAQDRLDAALHVARLWCPGDFHEGDVEWPLATLLQERALPSEHIRWGLIEPVRIYRGLIESASRRSGPEAIGASIRAAIDTWAAEMPIDAVWASLPSTQVVSELDWLDQIVLKSDGARARFRRRLKARFGDVQSVRHALAGMEPGDAR